MAFIAATVFGVGIAYFWPTMLGVTAERFPKGGALLLGLMGCFGNLAIWQALPQMGAIYDSYTVANLNEKYWNREIIGPNGKPVLDDEKKPLTLVGENTDWLTRLVADSLYPAGSRKINPEARKIIEESRQLVIDEKQGKLKDDAKTEKRLKSYAALFSPDAKDAPVNKEKMLEVARRILKEFDIPDDPKKESPSGKSGSGRRRLRLPLGSHTALYPRLYLRCHCPLRSLAGRLQGGPHPRGDDRGSNPDVGTAAKTGTGLLVLGVLSPFWQPFQPVRCPLKPGPLL
jgi:hypothetical protein